MGQSYGNGLPIMKKIFLLNVLHNKKNGTLGVHRGDSGEDTAVAPRCTPADSLCYLALPFFYVSEANIKRGGEAPEHVVVVVV